MYYPVNKINTQVPKIELEPASAVQRKTLHMAWGYLFTLLAFIFGVAFIYQLQNHRSFQNSYNSPYHKGQLCIQVITSAKNLQTGEVREFPTPCDVPQGWEVTPDAGLSVPSPFTE